MDVAMNINFDALYWPLKQKPPSRDPSYFSVADRFMKLAEKYNFKYTIFVIGKDLENAEIAARVKSWSEAGHEIANHSWSHNPHFGNLTKEKQEYEILRAHEIITRVTGREPRGFTAPAWSFSAAAAGILQKKNYLYDASVFPGLFSFLMIARLKIMDRNYWLKGRAGHLFAPQKPHFIGGLLEMPLPVTPLLRLPVWHTARFVFGKNIFTATLKKCLVERGAFYYVMHPADLADGSDLADVRIPLERINIPLIKKEKYIEESFGILCKDSKIITMKEMAENIIASGELIKKL
jgi:hypothetical protein